MSYFILYCHLFVSFTSSLTLQSAYFLFFFFFQAEDGIRDLIVTGVQTCALPIWKPVDNGGTRASNAADGRRHCRAGRLVRRVPGSGSSAHQGEARWGGPCRL